MTHWETEPEPVLFTIWGVDDQLRAGVVIRQQESGVGGQNFLKTDLKRPKDRIKYNFKTLCSPEMNVKPKSESTILKVEYYNTKTLNKKINFNHQQYVKLCLWPKKVIFLQMFYI